MNWHRLKDILLKQIMIIRCGGIRTSEEKLVVLRSLNSPEYIANQFTRYAFNESSLFDALTVLEGLTVQDLQEVADYCYQKKNEYLSGVTEK